MFRHKNVLISIPLISIVPIVFLVLGNFLGLQFNLAVFLFGAMGWYLALMLRLPFIFIFKKLVPNDSQLLTVLLSGPAEETIRFIFILFLIRSISAAYYLGLGWASIEIVYSLIQSLTLEKLKSRNDERARQAKKLINKSGMDNLLRSENIYWGIFERFFATAGHIAFSLLIFSSPIAVIATLPIHSLTNKISLNLVKHSIVYAEIFIAITFSAVFLISLSLTELAF